MGKRSDFERRDRDFYPTPLAAAEPLLTTLVTMGEGVRFCEPCAGDGALIDHLTGAGHECVAAWDIEPQRADIDVQNALGCLYDDRHFGEIDCFITNPPWDRQTLHPLIEHLSDQYPTWMLFDADWMHTRQSADFMDRCAAIISVGRVKWIPDSNMTGKDNCCWYLFDKPSSAPFTVFMGRRAKVSLRGPMMGTA